MIYGIGHDIIEIARVRKLVQKNMGERFITRILTEREQVIYATKGSGQTEYIAGRFAAKEAISKAFGTGIGFRISWQKIEILPDKFGKPIACLHAATWQRLGLCKGQYYLHLSISHQPTIASAQAIVEWRMSGNCSNDISERE